MGKAEPAVEKLITDHSEQMLSDMRSEGNRPKMKMPKPWAAKMVRSVKRSMGTMPPGCGNLRIPNI